MGCWTTSAAVALVVIAAGARASGVPADAGGQGRGEIYADGVRLTEPLAYTTNGDTLLVNGHVLEPMRRPDVRLNCPVLAEDSTRVIEGAPDLLPVAEWEERSEQVSATVCRIRREHGHRPDAPQLAAIKLQRYPFVRSAHVTDAWWYSVRLRDDPRALTGSAADVPFIGDSAPVDSASLGALFWPSRHAATKREIARALAAGQIVAFGAGYRVTGRGEDTRRAIAGLRASPHDCESTGYPDLLVYTQFRHDLLRTLVRKRP